jgi:tetratricopeptide (TPR) repeat protein
MVFKKTLLSKAVLRFVVLGTLVFTPVTTAAQHVIDIQRAAADGDYFKALATYDAMPKRRITTEATLAAAQSAWGLGLSDRARLEFDRVLRSEQLSKEERARVLTERGVIEFQEGAYQQAAVFAERAVVEARKYPAQAGRAYLLWGESLTALGQHAAARERYSRAILNVADNEKPEVYFLLGRAQFDLGDYGAARDNFERVPVDHPRAAEAIRGLAEASLKVGDFAQASFWLTQGRERFPQRFLDSWVDYALVRCAIGQKEPSAIANLRTDAEQRLPPSDNWLILMQGMAEAFEWGGLGDLENETIHTAELTPANENSVGSADYLTNMSSAETRARPRILGESER